MLLTCCLLAADGVLQISGKRKSTCGKMGEGKTPAQLKDELSGLKMRALQQMAEEVGVAQTSRRKSQSVRPWNIPSRSC